MRKPFFKKSHGSWYFEYDGRQINLGKDKEAAFTEYNRLMADQTPVTGRTTVRELCEQFLTWANDNTAPATFKWYEFYLKRFALFLSPKMRVSDLKPIHVTRW